MKTMTVESLADEVDDLIVAAPVERVLLTKNGKPFAIVLDATVYDDEDFGYMQDATFWNMIAQRRQHRGGVPLDKIRKRLEAAEARQVRSSASKKRSRK